MRIAIDIRKINEFGMGTYIWNLVRNIAALDTNNEYLLVGEQRHFLELGPLPPNFKQLYQPEGNSFLTRHWAIPTLLRRNRIDVFHVPHHEAPVFSRCKLVVTIHDCVHLLFPQEDESRFTKQRSYLRMKRILEKAKHILAVSHSTRDDLNHIFETPESKVSVVHNALDDKITAHPGNRAKSPTKTSATKTAIAAGEVSVVIPSHSEAPARHPTTAGIAPSLNSPSHEVVYTRFRIHGKNHKMRKTPGRYMPVIAAKP